ncbi:MAG: HD-GYP domain-containing protein [Negativicutes bacterium]|nr:HD-GYP domain-containing protein [Negativicutes bacterium]
MNKRIFVSDLTPGLEIGKAVVTEEGTVVLTEGSILTPSLIERLRQWGILTVYIRKEQDTVSAPESGAPNIQRLFADQYEGIVAGVRKSFETMRYFKEVPLEQLKELAEASVEVLSDAIGALNHLQLVKRQDDYTYRHSLNVAVITGVLGRWLGYYGMEMKNLILAGLLHDVGKTQIPLEVLNKPGKLSPDEMELMKKHTTRGYNMLRELPGITQGVLYGVLQHHERMDASGYPIGVPGEKIHPYAKIIAVADIYDAMTSNRAYQKSVSPFDVVQMLTQEMFNKLDPEICAVFLNNVRDYFVGNIVELSDGRNAEVLYIAQFVGARPIVRTADGEFIDLEKRKDLTIVNVLKT